MFSGGEKIQFFAVSIGYNLHTTLAARRTILCLSGYTLWPGQGSQRAPPTVKNLLHYRADRSQCAADKSRANAEAGRHAGKVRKELDDRLCGRWLTAAEDRKGGAIYWLWRYKCLVSKVLLFL